MILVWIIVFMILIYKIFLMLRRFLFFFPVWFNVISTVVEFQLFSDFKWILNNLINYDYIILLFLQYQLIA